MKKWVVLLLGMMGWCAGTRAGEVTLTFAFDPADVSYVSRGEYEKVLLAGGVLPEDPPGTPWLPAKFVNVLIPSGAQVTGLRVGGEEMLLREEIVVLPAQPPQKRSGPRNPFVAALPEAYAATERTPAQRAVSTGEHVMSGFSFVSVRLNPLRYLPAEKKLYLTQAMTLTVVYAEPRAPRAVPAARRIEGAEIVRSLVANPEAAAEFAPAAARGVRADTTAQYLVITRASCTNAFQTLLQHRSSRFNVKMLTVETITNTYPGVDAPAQLRACISNHWANHGTRYVVLGGDDTLVPVRGTKVSVGSDVESAMPTDLYYSGLDGNWNANGNSVYGEVTDNVDMAWEVIVGRIPIRTAAQASNYIAKLIAFETAPPTNLARKILLGGMLAWDSYTGNNRPSDNVAADGHPGFRDSNHPTVSDSEMWGRRLYRDGIRPLWQANTIGIFCDTLTSWDASIAGDYLQNAANCRLRFNEGWWHLFFSGHGDKTAWGLESGAFYSSDATALTNRLPFVYTDACLTGHFDGSTDPCLSEAFLRNPSGGAVLYIGCSRYGWGEPDPPPASNTSDGGPSTQFAYRYYQRLYESNNVTCGLAFAMHKADMISRCGSNDSERWIQFGLNLQGDPAIVPFPSTQSGTPPILSPLPPQGTTVGQPLQFAVTAQRTDGDPITNLWATGVPAGASFTNHAGNTNGLFSWPNPAATGNYTVVFHAGDKDGVSSLSVLIRVTNAPAGSPVVLRAQGFEGAVGDNWSYTTAAGSGTIALTTERAMSGGKSLKLTGSSGLNADPYVEFSNVNLAGYSQLQLTVAFSANGPDSDDDLHLDLSYDNGATWTGAGSIKLVDGYGNANLPFGATSATNPATVAANPWTVSLPAGVTQLKVRLRFDEKAGAANSTDHYYVDDLRLTGVPGGGLPPILQPIGNQSVQISNTLTFVVRVTPTDGDPITNLWASGVPAGAIFTPAANNTSGTFFWAGAAPAGNYPVTFRAGDKDGVAAETITITVTNPPPAGSLVLKRQDFEGTSADTWGYSPVAGGGSILLSSDRSYSGARSLRLAGSLDGSADPYVEFANVSLAGASGVVFSIAFSADGPDSGDDLWLDLSYDNGATWAVSTRLVAGYLNAKVSFGATNAANPATVGANPWTVAIPSGVSQIKVRIRFDEKAGAANTTDYYFIDRVELTAAVSGGPIGSPPILSPIGDKSILISNTLVFTVHAATTDGDPITNLWAVGVPAGAMFLKAANNSSGTFSWVGAAPAGNYPVTFRAGDKDGVAAETITITVVPASTGGGLRFQGFEGATEDNWSYTAVAGGGTIAVSTNRRMSGTRSLMLAGSATGNADPYVTFANVSLAGQSNVQLSVAFSADGPDSDDDLYLDLSYDNGLSWNGAGSGKLVDGYGNANVPFGETRTTNPVTVPANPWVVNLPAGVAQVAVRLRFDEKGGAANTGDRYYVDDLRLISGGGPLAQARAPLQEDAPGIAITEPVRDTLNVPNETGALAVTGTCNENVTGWLVWTNEAAGVSGAVLAGPVWTIPAIPLALGENLLAVTASNAAGATATATVVVTRRPDPESTGGATLAFQGFEESAGDSWGYTLSPNAAITTGRARTWTHALLLAGSEGEDRDPHVEFANVDLSAYDNAQIIVAFSAGGPDSGDDLWLDLSFDNGLTWNPEHSVRLVGGFRSLELPFDAVSARTVNANPYTHELPAGTEQVKVRLRFDEGAESDNSADFYFVDDIRIVAEKILTDDDDGDGLDDTWEEAYFQSLAAGPAGDDDGDGRPNVEEFILDTHPNDPGNPDAPFAIQGLRWDNGWQLIFPASVRRCYTLQYTDDLTARPQVWTEAPNAIRRRGTGTVMRLPLADAPTSRVYQLKVSLP